MNYIDAAAAKFRAAFAGFTSPCTYNGLAVKAFARGTTSEDTWAGALQQDIVGELDAAQFAAAFPTRPAPVRLDKMTMGGRTFTVMEWRGAPIMSPVFYKVLLRGGSQ